MAEYLDDVEAWKGRALEQALRAAKAEAELAAGNLRQHAEDLYAKYGLIKGVDRIEECDGRIEIVRVKSLEAVK